MNQEQNPNQHLEPNITQQLMLQQLKKYFKTPTGLKFAISILFGMVPMTLMWIGFNDGTDKLLNNEWLWNEISYGSMWGIAIGTFTLSLIFVSFLIKLMKDLKIDIFGAVASMSSMIMIFYIAPTLPFWARILIAIPTCLFIMVLTNMISMVSFFVKQTKSFQKGFSEFGDMMNLDPSKSEEILKKLSENMKKQGFDVNNFKKHSKKNDDNKNDIKAEIISESEEKIDDDKRSDN